MKTYILPGLDADDRQMLHEHGVVFHPWDSDILINADQLEQVLKLLNATATEHESDMENMFTLKLTFAAATPSVGVTAQAPRPTLDSNRQASRDRYIQLTQSRLGEGEKNARAELERVQKKLLPAQDNFCASARQRFIADNQAPETDFRNQYQRLLEVERVKSARVCSGRLFVWTEKLFTRCPDHGTRHDLGEFLIDIKLDCMGNFVRLFNQTRRVRTVEPGMNAPRIFADGSMVIDEIQETIAELGAQFDFATIVELVIQFAESTSARRLGKFTNHWPIAR